MTFVSALPFTDREREVCAKVRRKVVAKAVARRKLCPDKRHYDRQPTAADRARDARIMGERD